MLGLDIQFSEVPTVIAGILIVALAGWVGIRREADTTARVFSAFLAALGLYFAMDRASGDRHGLLSILAPYALFAIPFLGLLLGVRLYLKGPRSPTPAWLWVVLGVGYAALAIPITLDRRVFVNPDGLFDFGPLWPLHAAPPAVLAALALVMTHRYLGEDNWARRQGAWFLTLGLAIASLAGSGLGAFNLADILAGRFDKVGLGESFHAGAHVAAYILLITMVSSAIRGRRPGDRARGLVFAAALIATSQLHALLAPYAPTGDDLARFFWMMEMQNGIGLLVLAGLGAYSVMRHRVLGLDAKMRFTLKAGSLGVVFLMLSFVVSESAAVVVGERYGNFIGIGTAALTLVAIPPLQRVAERVAERALPEARPLPAMEPSERAQLYREQVEMTWADGTMTPGEKLRLDKLRARLGMTLEEASAIELDAAKGHQASA